MADAPDTEHPAAKRMRETFEAQYGDMHPIALALRHYYNARSEYADGWNRLREKPITEGDVDAAEQAVFAAVRAFAATPSPPVAAPPATPTLPAPAIIVNVHGNAYPATEGPATIQLSGLYWSKSQAEELLSRAAQPQPQPAQPLTGATGIGPEELYAVIRGFGYTTRNQSFELAAAILAALTAPSTPTPPEVAP